MGKIGNSLSYTMASILSGKTKYEEIDTIYAGTCFTREEAPEIISGYQVYWGEIAFDRAKMELGKEADSLEIQKRAQELRPQVTLEAEKLLNQLLDDNKIVQTRQIVPEGQTVEVEQVIDRDDHLDISKVKVNGDGRREVISINGELFSAIGGFGLGAGNVGFFNSELELIADQLSMRLRHPRDFEFLLKKMFPQYESEIEKMFEHIRGKEGYKDWVDVTQEELLELVQTPEHTAEEIGEATTPGAERDALEVIVGENERGKKQASGPDDH